MLAVDVVTIFPEMVRAAVSDGIVQRAIEKELVRVDVHDLRDYSNDRHRSVDDAPFGGGAEEMPGRIRGYMPSV